MPVRVITMVVFVIVDARAVTMRPADGAAIVVVVIVCAVPVVAVPVVVTFVPHVAPALQ
jgi:hypothetical protein